MPLSTAQQAICHDTHRFRVAVCGRRFGKTFMSIREMARFAAPANRKVCYIAPSYRQGKQTVWNDLKDRLSTHRWIRRVNESELTVTLINNSQILLRSADNYDSMRGLGLDFVVFDEFADIAKETWTEVIRPSLSDRQGHALFIGTPKGMGNWAKDLWDQGQDPQFKDWASFQYTTLDGGNVPEEEINSARHDLDDRTFRQEYEATFETYAGAIYYSFDRSQLFDIKTLQPAVQHNETLHIGIDFNVQPMSAVVAIKRNEKLYVIDAIEIYGSNTEELCKEIKQKYGNSRRYYAYPDASGGNSNTKGHSDHNILRNNGFEVRTANRNPAVRDRIAAVNSALKSSNQEIKLYINNTAKRLIECVEKHTYKGDTRQPDKTSGFDHLNDALGYLTVYHFPIQRPVKEDTTSVFGHF
jgi:Terminase large subunit, T4likevirus-type, N-terminal/Terminase RNaseH-like domain